MVKLAALQYLCGQKLKDGTALLQKGRNSAAIYLGGYALEFALKRKICMSFGFYEGFPEFPLEFSMYAKQVSAFNADDNRMPLRSLKQIRNHDLRSLLSYSGLEMQINAVCAEEWQEVQYWSPKNRYSIRRYSAAKARRFIHAIDTIIKQIF